MSRAAVPAMGARSAPAPQAAAAATEGRKTNMKDRIEMLLAKGQCQGRCIVGILDAQLLFEIGAGCQ